MKPLDRIQHVALDMDGTIYKGGTLFPTTVPFLKLLGDLGIGYTFLTNNPSKNRGDYVKHLAKMGIEATVEQLYTSTEATIEFIKANHPQVRRLFVLGTLSMCDEFRAAGFELMADDPVAVPDAVVVGFDTTLNYARVCRAAWWISQGKPYFATNPDRVCPTDQPTMLVDCGAITAMLEKATGISPTAVLGKPSPDMGYSLLRKFSLAPEQLAVVGDRLYTDLALAQNIGAFGVLVLTGETTMAEAHASSPQPDLIVVGIEDFGRHLSSVRRVAVTV